MLQPTLSLIPPSLELSSVPTGNAFLEALQAHDSHFGALHTEVVQQDGGGTVLCYIGVINVKPTKWRRKWVHCQVLLCSQCRSRH
jgi:hypothetical protein